MESMNKEPTNGKAVFREQQGIPRNYHEEPVLYGFGAAPELPDGMAVTYQSGGILFVQRYLYHVLWLSICANQSIGRRWGSY